MTHGLDAMPTSTQDDMSGNPLKEGILADGGWQNRQKRDESYASVRVAFGDDDTNDFSMGGQLPVEQDHGYEVKVPSHAFLVSPGGQVHSLPDSMESPVEHEALAQTLGDPQQILGEHALGRLYSDGSTSWHGNGTRHSPEMLSRILSDHFGQKTTVNPDEQGLQQASWDPLERISADFEAEHMDVVPPGGHTVETLPGPNGLHGGVIGPLKSIKGLTINGRPLDDNYAQELGSWEPSDPLMISHDDPQLADVAKQVIETGGSGPLVQHAMSTQAGHRGQVQLPHGLTNNVHQVLGNLGAWVSNPAEGDELRPWKNGAYRNVIRAHHDQMRPSTMQVGVRDPGMMKVIQDVAHSDDLQPLYSYHGIPKQANPALLMGLRALAPGLLEKAAPSLMGAAMGTSPFGGGAAHTPAPNMPTSVGELGEPDYQVVSALEHPDSVDHMGDDGDPEHADTQEVNDGDNTPGQDFKIDNAEGGTDSPGVKAMEGALPLVLEFALSNESGEGHPLLNALHEMLEEERPGYLSSPDDDAAHQVITILKGDGHKQSNDLTDMGLGTGTPNPGHVPNPNQQFATPLPTGGNHGKCPVCGSTYDPSHPTCPQCGAGTISMPGQNTVEQEIGGMQIGASNVPPLNEHSFMYEPDLTSIPEGMSLEQWRQSQPSPPPMTAGPCPHCQKNIDMSKGYCPHCLNDLSQHMAKLAADHQGPHTPEQIAAVQQMLLDTNRKDEVPNVPMQPWQYARELAQIQNAETPPEGPNTDPAPPQEMSPNETMPMPPMQAPPMGMQAALDRHLAKNPVAKDSRWSVLALDLHDEQDADQNPIDLPAADVEKPFDPEMDQDASHTWVDINGEPIQVGETYKVHSDKFSIPDVLQILAVKPESVEVKEVGAYGLGYSREITHEESQLDGCQFESVGDFGDQPDVSEPEEPGGPDLDVGPGDQTDLSGSSPVRSHVKEGELHGWKKPPIEKSCPVCGGGYNQHDPECPLNEQVAKQREQRSLEQAWRMPTVDHPLGPTAKTANHGFTCPQCQYTGDTAGQPLPSACPQCGITGYTMWNDDPDLQHYLNPSSEEGQFDPVDNMQQHYLQQQYDLPSVQHPLGPATGKTADSINLEPNWDGMRAYVLNMARSDIDNALKINASMGREGVPEEELLAAHGSQNINAAPMDWDDPRNSHVAGAKFTPIEQRVFIDEQGSARNSDLLDLSNTHYEANFEDVTLGDDFLFGL